MTSELFTALVVFVLVASITPGPNNMMLLASGLNFGFRRTAPHMLGIVMGMFIMVALVGLGIGQAFERAPWLHEALKLISVAYMLWLAWKLASAPATALAPGSADAGAAPWRPMTFLEAAAFQWVNPKGWTMFLSAVSAYTVPGRFYETLVIVVAVVTAIGPVCVVLWTALGVSLRSILSTPTRVRWFNCTMALALVASLWPVAAEYLR